MTLKLFRCLDAAPLLFKGFLQTRVAVQPACALVKSTDEGAFSLWRRRLLTLGAYAGLGACSASEPAPSSLITLQPSTNPPEPSEAISLQAQGVSQVTAAKNADAQTIETAVAKDLELVIVHPNTKRPLKLKVRLPAKQEPTALLLYSPGLGSGVSGGAAWCEAWREAGYLVATLAHPVTDDSIWSPTQKKSFKATIGEAIASPQYPLRVADCSFALDHLLALKSLKPYLDPSRIGIAGHSYGALTVQSLAGQDGQGSLDRRIKAAIALSPSAMSRARVASMAQVKIPFFCVVGELDAYVTFMKGVDAVQLGVPLSQREWVYNHLPQGKKQELWVSQADHMTFAGESIDAKRVSRDLALTEQNNPATWRRVSALTTEFWNFYLNPIADFSVNSRDAYIKRMQALKGPKDRLKFD